jgi:PleD family two-component response regulator
MLLKKLVIAEDDDAIAHLVAAGLGDAGYLCLRARDGEEALDLVRSELPDLLVLDLMMPKLDGIQVCKRIKSDVVLSRVPILMLTSMAGVEQRIEGLEAGADDYLSKPFDLREVAARVKALIRQNRRERDRNPTTNLPGVEALEDHVSQLLRDDKPFELLYIDIENFRTYADVYGYRKADEVVAYTGQLILAQCRTYSGASTFVGHIGGDDFIVVCQNGNGAAELRDGLTEAFRDGVEHFYSDADRKQGFIIAKQDQGETRRAQFMSVSVALVPVRPGQYESTEQLALEVTQVKAESRMRTGSGLFVLPPQRS